MRTLCILCLIHGVRSAVLLSKKENGALMTDKADELTPPVFIVSGFLAHNGNGSSAKAASVYNRRHQWASAEDHKAIKDECTVACGKGVDSSCVPECQVKLYGCLDYDRKTPDGLKEYKQCEKKVLDTHQKFGKNWEATHPYTTDLIMRSKGGITATDIEEVQDDCAAACGKGVDSSCVPECQVKMYTCLDNDRKVPEGLKKYKECKKNVLETYKKFAADWDSTHPYLLAVGRRTSAKDLHSIQDKCVADCGSKSKISCLPRCQTSLYACLHIDASQAAGEYATCAEYAKRKVAKAEAASSTAAEDLASVAKACTSACGLGADAGCLPECEVQMYSCSGDGKAEAKKYTACTEKVLTSYEKFASDWNAAHSYLLNHRGHADAETLEEMRDECVEACGPGVDTSCVPECQVKMYTCLDHDRKVPEGAKKYTKCTAEVLATYERFADDWDKAHPYLLAVHRHVASVELAQISDKCHEACGKGVDSSCVPECQVEMYTCLDHDRKTKVGAKAYDECESKVVTEYQEFGKNWDSIHPYGAK